MPWVQLDNVVVGALIGLVGIVCGNLISGWSQRRVEHEHSRLPELILAFDAMKTELERLILKVDRLEKDLEAATLDLDQTRARYRAALSWGHKLQRIIEDRSRPSRVGGAPPSRADRAGSPLGRKSAARGWVIWCGIGGLCRCVWGRGCWWR